MPVWTNYAYLLFVEGWCTFGSYHEQYTTTNHYIYTATNDWTFVNTNVDSNNRKYW